MEYLLLVISVTAAVASVGFLVPMARRDADRFGAVSAGLVATASVVGCCFVLWLLSTRRIVATEVEAFFSVLLLAGVLWTVGFLFPMARRDRNLFGIVCAVVAGLLALTAWLLLGTGVQSR